MTAEEIAAGLTEAQKRAVFGVKQMYQGEYLLNSSSRLSTCRSVVALGLAEQSSVFANCFRLTPLGNAVRAYLEGTNHV